MINNLNTFYETKYGFNSHNESIRVINDMRDDGLSVRAIMESIGCSRGFIYSRLENIKRRAVANHKVVSVKCDGIADVYNFEVDIYHNYAFSSGVFSHNCHPRDNIAMSWFAQQLDLSHDLFNDIMFAREEQAKWLCGLIVDELNLLEPATLPIIILGYAFKPGTNMMDGSPALLCETILQSWDREVDKCDPFIDKDKWKNYCHEALPAIYLIGCRHKTFAEGKFPVGSIVIDPFRYIPNQPGVKVIRVGDDYPITVAHNLTATSTVDSDIREAIAE